MTCLVSIQFKSNPSTRPSQPQFCIASCPHFEPRSPPCSFSSFLSSTRLKPRQHRSPPPCLSYSHDVNPYLLPLTQPSNPSPPRRPAGTKPRLPHAIQLPSLSKVRMICFEMSSLRPFVPEFRPNGNHFRSSTW